MVFRQVPFVPQIDSQYFGKYGPLAEQVAVPDLATSTDLMDDTKLTYPAVALSIKDKVLENTQDLVLLISTNDYLDPEDIYLLQIKQKEKVVHQEILKMKPKLQKEKYIIDATNFQTNLEQGGILQVNLYKTTEEYEDFNELVGSQTFCSLSTLTSAYPSMGTTDQTVVDTAASANVLEDRIYNALNKIKITVPGTTCILISPDLVQKFLEPLASISILKKPAVAYQVDITTNDMTTGTAVAKDRFIQGNSMNVNLKLKNVATGQYLKDLTNAQYASIIITEDVTLDASAFYKSSFPGKIYLENEVDFEKYQALDPLNQINQHFTTSKLTGSTDQVLDILLTINNLRNSVFEAKTFSILGRQQDFANVFKNAMPKTFEQLSQLFGFNFQKNTLDADPVFTEADIRNYAGFVTDAEKIQKNIVNLAGSSKSYHRKAPAFDVYSSVTNAELTSFALTLDASYKSFDNKYIGETQLFRTNRAFIQSAPNTDVYYTTSTFSLGDLATNFKVIAYSYGPSGFGYGEKVITVGAAFQVDFNLPSKIQTGDKINVTATIQNYHGLAMTVTPDVAPNAASMQDKIKVDWTYNDWTKNAQNKWVSASRSTWPFTTTQTSRQIPFQIEAVLGDENNGYTVDIAFTFTAVTTNGTSTTITVLKSLTVVPAANWDEHFKGGSLQTSQYPDDGHILPSEDSIKVTLPSADLLKSVSGKLTLYPVSISYMISQVRSIMDNNVVDKHLVDIVEKLAILKQFIGQFSSAPFPEFKSMAKEAEQFRQLLLEKVYLFVVKDPVTQEAIGFDSFKYTDQIQGDVVMTAYATMLLDQACGDLIVADATKYAVQNQNVAWLLTKLNGATFDTSNSQFIDSSADSAVVQAFITHSLNPISISNNVDSTIALNLNIALTSVVRPYLANTVVAQVITVYQSGFKNLVDPYLIELLILALYQDNYGNEVGSLIEMLYTYQQQYGFVETPMGENVNGADFKIRAAGRTILGGLGKDRDLEIAAIAGFIYSYSPVYSGTLSFDKVKAAQLILSFVKRRSSSDGFFGSFRQTRLVNQILIGVSQIWYDTTTFNVDVSYKGKVVTYQVHAEYTPIVLYFDAAMLGLVAADAGTELEFAIEAYNVVNPKTYNTLDINGNTVVNYYDSVIDYSFQLFQLKNDLDNTMTSQHGLSFSVIALNQTGLLGLEANLGKVFEYEVILFNQNANRAQGPLYIKLRPSACLSVDSTQFALLKGSGKTSPIQAYQTVGVDYRNEYLISTRGLEPKGHFDTLSFKFHGTQVSSGTCSERPFEAGYYFSESVTLYALPA